VTLEGCTLDFDGALLRGSKGESERLADRKEGVSRKLYNDAPIWNSLLVPVKTPANRAKPARLLFVLTDRELLAWVNAFERASLDTRAKIVRTTTYLDRLTTPGTLVGQVVRDSEAEGLQRALGREAAPGVMVLRPGVPPGLELSPVILGSGVLGAALLILALGRFTGHSPVRAATAYEDVTQVSSHGVKLEIGGLEALREEERKKKTK
jgi:hypothetical protein